MYENTKEIKNYWLAIIFFMFNKMFIQYVIIIFTWIVVSN